LSKEILFGKLSNGGVVEIGVENDKLTLNYIDILPVKQKVLDSSSDEISEN
jgi:hypothetical protein